MKLEDEIMNALSPIGPGDMIEVIEAKRKTIPEIKSLIERYCKRQRELCAGHYASNTIFGTSTRYTQKLILDSKLATEEE